MQETSRYTQKHLVLHLEISCDGFKLERLSEDILSVYTYFIHYKHTTVYL